MHVSSAERVANSVCQQTILEIDAAMILVPDRLGETTRGERASRSLHVLA
ncbi:MAG TPA: hypothetical protein VE959_27695 [Bryobacteraceae bacterium]|nr:hypothetical protein [Bryobacteraceae bacterium]